MTRLIYLNPLAGKIQSLELTTLNETTILDSVTDFPDGITIDPKTHQIYWTNMGSVNFANGFSYPNDGSVEKINFDGTHRTTIIPRGKTRTPKQITADWELGKIYWCDREGQTIWRANLDGSDQEPLVEREHSDDQDKNLLEQCVGIAIDTQNGYLYWTQKGSPKGGQGRIFRAGLNIPTGSTPHNRPDIELLWDNLPEPIDLYLNAENNQLFWTDRGKEPEGNTLNAAPVPEFSRKGEPPTILLSNLVEGIGVDLDRKTETFYVTDLGGNIHYYELGSQTGGILTRIAGVLTGIAVVD